MSRQIWQKVFSACLMITVALGVTFGLHVSSVQAMTADSMTVTVTQAVVGTPAAYSDPKTFFYRLVPSDATCPLPAGSDAAGFAFSIIGNRDGLIGPIVFAEPGIYTYELIHITDADKSYGYDQEAYRLSVLITRDKTASIVIHKQNGSKAEAILYSHRFVAGKEVTSLGPKSPDGSAPVGTAGFDGVPKTGYEVQIFLFALLLMGIATMMLAHINYTLLRPRRRRVER